MKHIVIFENGIYRAEPVQDDYAIVCIHETLDGALEYISKFDLDYATQYKRHGKATRVMCVDTGKTYYNAMQAAAENFINQSSMSQHLNYPDVVKTVKGLTFKRV